MTLMVGSAAYLLNRYEGKVAKVLGIEFGEAVLWKRRPVAVANEKEVWKTLSVERKLLEAR